MTNQDFDRLVNSVRDDVPDAEVVRAAAAAHPRRLVTGRDLAGITVTFFAPEYSRRHATQECR